MKINLPLMSHTWTFEGLKGNETGSTYPRSEFTYERLSLGGRLKVNKMEAKLREELITLAEDVKLYIEMVSLLRYGLTEYPDWWKDSHFGLEIHDINVITSLYNEVERFEIDWEEKIQDPKSKPKDLDELAKAD